MTRRLRTPRRDGDDQRSAVRAREMREEVCWRRVLEAEWARLFPGVCVLLGKERNL